MTSLVQALLMGAALVAVVYGMLSDFGSMRIPNRATVVIALSFFPVALLAGLPWQSILIDHLGTGIAILAVGLVVFARGWMGGGDIKLLVAIGTWIGWPGIGPFFLLTALLGGVVAVFALFLRRMPGAMLLVWIPALRNGFGDGKKVPYGLAIGAAALAMAPRLDTLPPGWLH